MNHFKTTVLIGFATFILQGCFLDTSDEACYHAAHFEISCNHYNNNLLSCYSEDPGPEGRQYLPGCEIVESCTDYTADMDTDTNTDTNTDTDTDTIADTDTNSGTDSSVDSDTSSSDTSPQGIVCKQTCEGELVPCEGMEETQCRNSRHCEWYDDSAAI